MFDGFARQWTPLLPSSDITRTPRQVRVAGENLVAWRDNAGRAGVLLDRCPHRSVALSEGKRTDDGNLACAFHGWEFATDGACAYIPFNPKGEQRRGATALPVVEEKGYVWVFTGFDVGPDDPRPNAAETLAPTAGSGERVTRWDYWEEWNCHWTRAMENMLDFPHLPFLHRTTIGRFVRAKMTRDSVLNMAVEKTDYGFESLTGVDEHPPAATLRWYSPNGMTLDAIPAPRQLTLHIFCVPIDDTHTRMILTTVRNFAHDPATSLAFNAFNTKVLHQDRPVVESSDPVEVPERGVETSVPTDKATLTFRTWYHRNLPGTTEPDPRG